MQTFLGIFIPFLGTTAGAACVFFMKKSLGDLVQRSLAGFAAGVMVAASIWSLLIPAIEQSAAMGKLSFVPAFFGFWFGVLFLLVMFFSPLAEIVPGYATAGALIFVGVLMTSSLARIDWDDFTESVPAFITAVMMPFTFSITEGIALGFLAYCIMKIFCGRWRELNLCVIAVAMLFALKIILVD